MSEYLIINIQNIKQHLSELDKEDSERTLSGLDLLIDNIEYNLLNILQDDDKLMIEINHDKKEITLLWEILPSDHWKILFDKEKNNESIYNTLMDAINYINQTEWWEELIKEIQSKSDSL